MENNKIVKKYFNKYFKNQYFKEDDHEFKSLLKILNKKDKLVKNLNNCKNCNSTNISVEPVFRCRKCGCFHGMNGEQL